MTWPSRRALVVIVVVVVGLTLIGSGGWIWYSSYERRGATAYAEAMTRVQASYAAQASAEVRDAAIRDLEGALKQYPSGGMAAQAAYELGNLRYGLRQYAAARAAWEIALARAGSGTLRTLARAGIGYSWEAERSFPKAAESYQAALSETKPKGFLYEELLADLARTQELAGRKDDAVATYRRVVKEMPNTPRADDARTRLASLGATP